MKIEQSTKLTTSQLVKDVRSPAAKKSGQASEEVQLSSLASELAAPGNEAPFDAGHVEEIKQAIAQGRFNINAGAIADRLIASAKELVDSQPRA